MPRTQDCVPSRTTLYLLGFFFALVTLLSFWVLSADLQCAVPEVWTCTGFGQLAVSATLAGAGIALLFTSLAVLGSGALARLLSRRLSLEPKNKTWSVTLALAVLHVAPFGLLQVLGSLPIGWVWWLGLVGAVGAASTGQVWQAP